MATKMEDGGPRECLTFIWRLNNYSDLAYFDIHSPLFCEDVLANTQWRLLFSDQMDLEAPAACCIQRGPDGRKGNITVSFEIAIVDENGQPLSTQRGEKCFEEGSTTEWLRLTKKCDILREKDKYLPNNALTLRCQLWVKSLIARSDLCFACTELGVENREVLCNLKEFSHLLPGQKRTIKIHPLQREAPSTLLSVYLKQTGTRDYVVVEVDLGDRRQRYTTTAKISLMDSYGQLSHAKDGRGLIASNDDCLIFDPFIEKSILRMNEGSFLSDDTLRLKCDLKTSFGVVLSQSTSASMVPAQSLIDLKDMSESSRTLPYDLINMRDVPDSHAKNAKDPSVPRTVSCDLLNRNDEGNANEYVIVCCPSCPLRRAIEDHEKRGNKCDVRLISGMTSFYAHKDILGELSPVFKIMLAMVAMKVIDLDPICLHRLLLYIYTLVVEDITRDEAYELLKAAEMFQVEDLEEECTSLVKEYFERKRRDKRYRMVIAREKIPKVKCGEVLLGAITSPFA